MREHSVGTNGGAGTRRSRCRSKESRSSDNAHSYPTDVRTCTVESCVELDECTLNSRLSVTLALWIFCAPKNGGLEGSTAASVQPYTANLPRNKFSVVRQEPMRAVFKVWPEVRSTVHVDDKKFVCKHQSGRRDNNSTESV